ncbi:MAG TPA: hypothetical protein VEA99_00755 [Gemmatimonadaceae bacterium]|nr:hypothetical protein [Gemmatimonadaceae bacterium]
MSLHIPVQSTLTLSRTGDGSNITAGFRGYAFVDVAPNRWYVPTLQIREAGVNLGTGDIGLKGDVILPVEVKGNLREGIIDVSVGGYKKRIELEPDKK